MPKEEPQAAPKPAPPTRYGPTFDEIERRDPVQWHAAHMAWVSSVVLCICYYIVLLIG